jgi:hypothetical protein
MSRGKAMNTEDKDITQLDDTTFFEERRRIRELLEHEPTARADPELTARYQRLNDEFCRRAQEAWNAAW